MHSVLDALFPSGLAGNGVVACVAVSAPVGTVAVPVAVKLPAVARVVRVPGLFALMAACRAGKVLLAWAARGTRRRAWWAVVWVVWGGRLPGPDEVCHLHLSRW